MNKFSIYVPIKKIARFLTLFNEIKCIDISFFHLFSYLSGMNTYAEENYLKALFNLSNDKGEVTVQELSKELQIKMPSVNSMIKKLAEKKLVLYESYKPLRLSEKGKKEAGLIIRKHRLTEMYLVEKMGFGWEQVHEIAEQVEHLQSPLFFEKMDELLGFPSVDPHGSPIPDKNGRIQWLQYKKLSDINAGTSVKLMAVTNSSEDFLKFLNSRNLFLGLQVKILHIETFDGSIQVSYGKKEKETLSKIVAEKLLTVVV
jgi:DtxR family transcriptional regulator, Mn-dependent transcriptional regulator